MEEPVISPGVNGIQPADAPSNPTLDPQVIFDYLTEVLSANLGASKDDLEASGSLLSSSSTPDTLQRCQRFAAESQPGLYVQKSTVDGPAETDGINGDSGMFWTGS
jgi:dynein heavy chain 1, cytosolic